MTVRHQLYRVWLAAILGSASVAQADEPNALPPLPGATPTVPPPVELPPLTPASGTVPTVPPPAALPPLVPPAGGEPKAPTAPAAPAVPSAPAVPAAPTAPAVPAPMAPMAPMPTAAPILPPMNLPPKSAPAPSVVPTVPKVSPVENKPSEAKTIELKPAEVKPAEVKPAEVKPISATVQVPPMTPVKPMAPATPPTFETASVAKAAPVGSSSVKIDKPAIDGLAAYSMMLAEAKIAYAKINDYSGHVIHQDRVRGKLTADQTAEIRVRTKPMSVSLKYVAPNSLMGQELAYVDGRNGGKVRFKPAGSFGPGGFSTLDLADSRATANTRHAITEFGIGPMIELLEKNLIIEQRLRNAVQVTVAEYVYANRPVTRFEVYTDRAHALRFAYRTVVYVDKESKLPIRIEAYDQPAIGGSPTGELLESYSYVNLKFNQGLGEAVFER